MPALGLPPNLHLRPPIMEKEPPTILILQNSLAKAAGLLFQAGEFLTIGDKQCLLKIEIAAFMLETRKSLSTLLTRLSDYPTLEASGRSAPIVERRGLESTSPPPWKGPNMSLLDGPVGDATTPLSPPEQSGNSLSGGTIPPPSDLDRRSWAFPTNLSDERRYSERAKSSAYLSLTLSDKRKLLVAKSDISNIYQADDGCIICYKSKPEPDQVLESFSYIESELQ